MKTCLNCGKEVSQTEGKRERKYCNNDCKTRHWVKTHPKKKPIEVIGGETRVLLNKLQLLSPDYYQKFIAEFGIKEQNSTQKPPDTSKTDSNQKDAQNGGQEKEGVERAKNEARIAELEKELKSPPKSPLIGMKAWLVVREKELKQLREQ